MNNVCFQIANIQHIKSFEFKIDLAKNQLMCIVGKNGTGKTTIVKALKTLLLSDTFKKTSSSHIFSKESEITYKIDDEEYTFIYNEQLETIDSKDIIEDDIKNDLIVELPFPYGDRFTHFQKLGEIDKELREKIILQNFISPDELIKLYQNIYKNNKFDKLKEVVIRGKKYYIVLQEDNYYIREDYFSSGEYFVLNIYKLMINDSKLIFIDEIDISLDAMAQVNIIKNIKNFCQRYNKSIVFTTHSLAIMKTLPNDLYYLENNEGICTLENHSYSYIKSLLYGFEGWDKYILTEDRMLQKFMEFVLEKENIFSKYKIIYIGGGQNVVDLMQRNIQERFFSEKEDVLSVLDGDQKDEKYIEDLDNVLLLPFESVEKQLKVHYDKDELKECNIGIEKNIDKNHKDIYFRMIDKKYMTQYQVFQFLDNKHQETIKNFKEGLVKFLNYNKEERE